jgi:glycosyltransferase involved in cell wall biosynthesis
MARRLSLNGHREAMRSSAYAARPARGLRLVELGLRWPPETFLQLKLARLADRGLEVIVGSADAPRATGSELAGVQVKQFPSVNHSVHGARPLRRGLMQLRPDVLHFEWLTVASSHLPLLEAWPGPVVVSCRGSDLPIGGPALNRPAEAALEAVFARADAVHCVAQAARRDALAFGLAPEKACLIPAAVDGEFFKPPADQAPDEDAFTIVSVGWLRWLKGHEYGVLALAELVRVGIPAELEILGGDPTADTLEQSQRARILHTARDLGVADRVHLHGDVEPAEVRAQLQRADVFLHPSLSEGLPNVILEAMACALPVVATDVGGTEEAVRDGIDGFVVPPRDPGAAAAALRALWRDPELRRRMGEAGRAQVETGFTLKRQTDRWIEVYERVTAVA